VRSLTTSRYFSQSSVLAIDAPNIAMKSSLVGTFRDIATAGPSKDQIKRIEAVP
jgi:hypothetical protein